MLCVHLPRLAPFAGLALMSVALGCGGSSSGPSGSTLLLPAGGGTVSARGGDVTLTLPAGAVAADTKVTAEPLSSPPERDRVVAGTAFRFTSTAFALPIKLRIMYDESKLPEGTAEDDLAIYKLVDGAWTPTDSVVDPDTDSVTAMVDGFSDYGILSSGSSVAAEATYDEDGLTPSVRVSWRRNGFTIGTGSTSRWQVYRNDVSASPVLVLSNPTSRVLDSSSHSNTEFTNYADFATGGTTCEHTEPANATLGSTPSPVPGRSYFYQVQAVYGITSIDLPGGGSAGGTGTTAGGTGITSGGTGVTTGTTSGSTGGEVQCYFVTEKATTGRATPLVRPIGPTSATLTSNVATLSFQAPSGIDIILRYVLEFSSDPSFPRDRTVGIAGESATGGTIVRSVDTTSGLFAGAATPDGTPLSAVPTLYCRAGIRNAADRPGPVRDPFSGLRYLYGPAATLTRPSP